MLIQAAMRRIVLVVVVVAVVVAIWWWGRSVEVVTQPTSVTTNAPAPPPPPSLPQARKPRVVLPRPPKRTLPTRTDGAAAQPERPTLVDRRPAEERSAGDDMTRLHAHVDAVDASVSACIGEWMALDPTLSAKVMLGFSLGPDGLQEAWVDDHGEVPAGPLSCFAGAVYEEDWSGIVTSPAEVTMEFVFDGDEAP